MLDCRSLTHEYVDIPRNLISVICDTCAPRQLSGSEYGLRLECESAAAFFAKLDPDIRTLRDVPLTLFAEHREQLPEQVQRRAQFVIEENARVAELAGLLKSDDRDGIKRITEASFVGARDLFGISVPAMQAHVRSDGRAPPGWVGCRRRCRIRAA